MPVIKLDLLMESGNSGWSESWYIDDSSATVLNVINNLARPVGQARANMLGKFAKLTYARASDIAVDRDSLVLRLDLTNQLYPGNTSDDRADGPGVGWYVRVEAGAGARRQLFLRGMPDGWFSRNATGDVSVPPALATALAAYLGVCRANGMKIQRLKKADDGNATFRVNSLVNNTNFVGLTFYTPATIAAGDVVQTYNFRGYRPAFSGRFLVTAVDPGTPADSIKLARQYNFTALGTVGKNAAVRIVQLAYSLPIDMIPIRPATRRVGRPSFLPVGRRRRVSK